MCQLHPCAVWCSNHELLRTCCMLVYQALQLKFRIMRHVFSKYLRTRFLCARHTLVRAFFQNSGHSSHAQYTNMVQQCCVTCQDIAPVYVPPTLCFLFWDEYATPRVEIKKSKQTLKNLKLVAIAAKSGRRFAYKRTRIPTNVPSALRCWIGLF